MKRLLIAGVLLALLITPVMADIGIILMGGEDAGGLKNDTWRSTDGGNVWTRINASVDWVKRNSLVGVVIPNGSIVITGGEGSALRNDTWMSTDGADSWTRINDSSGWIKRSYLTGTINPDGDIFIMGGSKGGGVYLNDTWRSTDDGKTWTQMSASSGWTERELLRSVALPDNSIVIMGGYISAAEYENDVWRSTDDGATWTEVNSSAGWVKRASHTSVVLPDGSIVLMGGLIPAGTALNDTWRSTDLGATWTQMNASSGWTKRYAHTSVVLPNGSIVLMGGVMPPGTVLNDTWISGDKGATWTLINASAGWTARAYTSTVTVFAPPPYIGNGIYGIVYDNQTGAGVNSATVMARNATAYSLNTTFTYLGTNGVYFFENAVDSEDVTLNATKTGYNLSSDYLINTGVAGSAVRQDILLNPIYDLGLTFRDATSGALITPASVDIVMTGTKTHTGSTTTGILTVTDIPFGWITVTTSSAGYFPDTRSYLMTADAADTINLTSTTAAQQAMWNSPHQVRWLVVDRYGNRIPNVWVNVTPISMTLPSGNWLLTMFGLGSTVAPTINTSVMNGTTGTDGALVFTMLGSIKYDLQFTNAALGINHLIHVNPIEDQYTVWVVTSATAVATNCGMTANATLFVNTTGTAWTNLNVSYMDSSLTTTNFTFWLQWPNGTTIHSTDFFGPTPNNQTVYTNWTVANTAGQMYVWGYWANTSACGNFSQAQGITLKGPTGRITSLDPCNGYALGWDATC